MTDTGCGRIRDLLPLHRAGSLGEAEVEEVERHLAGCEDCRVEAAFVDRLLRFRPEPPAGLAAAILAAAVARPGSAEVAAIGPDAVRRPTGGSYRSWIGGVSWPLKAAAVLVLALGVGTMLRPDAGPTPTWTLALESDAAVEWYGNEWMVAGEAQLDALTDEQLLALLEELER